MKKLKLALGGLVGLMMMLAPCAAAQTLTFGGEGMDSVYDMIRTDADETYLVGATTSADWLKGGYDETYDGGIDGFILKLDPSGGVIWGSYVSGRYPDAADWCYGVTVSNGAVYVAGECEESEYWSMAFVTKLTSDGEFVWTRRVATGWGTQAFVSVAVDANGDVLTHGYGQDPFWSEHNGLLCKWTPDGDELWRQEYGHDIWADYGSGMAIAPNGNIVLTGTTFIGDWTWGGYDTTPNGGLDPYVLVLGSRGVPLWSTLLGGFGHDMGRDVAVGDDGTIYVTGQTDNDLWWENPPKNEFGGVWDGFCVAVTPNGTHKWSRYIGASGEDVAWSIDVGANIVVTGSTQSRDWFTGTAPGGVQDAFVHAMLTNGQKLRTFPITVGDVDVGAAVVMGTAGDLYVAGTADDDGFLVQRPPVRAEAKGSKAGANRVNDNHQ